MLRAVLFELNGVLVDDEPIQREAFQRVLADEGLSWSVGEDAVSLSGRDDRSRFAAVLAAAGEAATVPRLLRLGARKSSYYQERIRERGYPFFPGAVELVTELAAAGRMLGVVTGSLRDEVEEALRQGGIRDRFKVLVTAEDVREGKPDPEGFLRALEALNSFPPLPERLVHPHEVLAIEDSPAGLAAAAEIGLVTLAVAPGEEPKRLRSAHAVVPRLAEMTLGRLDRIYAEVSFS